MNTTLKILQVNHYTNMHITPYDPTKLVARRQNFVPRLSFPSLHYFFFFFFLKKMDQVKSCK
jgi:hypothetical protein